MGAQRITVKLHKYVLTPAMCPRVTQPAGGPYTVGVGQQVRPHAADTITIPSSDVTPVPAADCPHGMRVTKCIKVMLGGTEYQVITQRAIPF
ncbi:MAG: hypothetical protein R3C18_05765 [Planctomycetaceae bacterium]